MNLDGWWDEGIAVHDERSLRQQQQGLDDKNHLEGVLLLKDNATGETKRGDCTFGTLVRIAMAPSHIGNGTLAKVMFGIIYVNV